MKVLLIYPPTFNMIKTNLPAFVDEEVGVYPPLGLLYIAAYAQKNIGYDVKILDCNALKLSYAEVEKRIEEFAPDVVGIQVFTFTLIDALKVADIVKKINPYVHVCMGGPHVAIYPVETLSFPLVDSVVRGEGEHAFSEILNALEGLGGLSAVKGIMFKKDGKIIDTGPRPFLTSDELNALPFPARQLVANCKYSTLISEKNSIATMITSRGCPFKCIFCDRPQMGKAFRARSVESIISELNACLEMGISEFLFYDDTFTVNKKRVLDLCEKLIEIGMNRKIIWDVRSRLDTIDEEMIKKMRLAGCKRIHYGVESGTERVLKILNKDITLKQAINIFRATSKNGIQTLAYFILGNPTETKEEMAATIEFSKKLKPDYVHFSLMTPFPGTEIYKMALAKGVAKFDYWKKFAENPNADFEPMFWEEGFMRDDLAKILSLAYKSFYLRPFYMLRQLFKLKSPGEFRRKFKAGMKLIKH